jgi:hypothetical protein
VDVFETGRKCMVVHAPLTNLPLHTLTQTASKKCDHVVTTVQTLVFTETSTIRWGMGWGVVMWCDRQQGRQNLQKKKKNIMNQEKFIFYTENF